MFPRPDWQYAVVFLLPVLLLAIVVRFVPAVVAARESLYRGVPGSIAPPEFVWFQNYVDAFGRESFREMLGLTMFFNVVLNPLQVGIALVVALLLTQQVWFRGLWRALIFIPVGIPHVVSAITWGMLMRPAGPINAMLEAAGLPAQPFLTSSSQAMFALMVIAVWIGTGFWMLFLIAGLNDVPKSYYEAANIDGAGFWRSFLHITLPLIRRPMLFVLVANTVANFVLFAIVQVLTSGGPEGSTNLIMFDIYEQAYTLNDRSTAAVETMILLGIMLCFVAIQFWLLREPKNER